MTRIQNYFVGIAVTILPFPIVGMVPFSVTASQLAAVLLVFPTVGLLLTLRRFVQF